MLSFKPNFSLSSFTVIKRLFSSHLHIWGYWNFSQQSWFQLVIHPAGYFTWCTLHRTPAELFLENGMKVLVAQSCPTLCNSMDCSLPGSSVHGILQARIPEWVAISFSNAWKWKVKSLSHVWLFVTPWTAAHQAPPPMGFSRQEYWSGVPFPSLDMQMIPL